MPVPLAVARRHKWLGCLLVALALVAWFAAPGLARRTRANFGTAPAQCANRENGPSNPINDCTGSAWFTGNLNDNKSLYREGDFVPFRTQIAGLVAGRTYSLRIGYDALVGGLHAYDYLGSYDASAAPGQQIVPCSDIGADTVAAHACVSTAASCASRSGRRWTVRTPAEEDRDRRRRNSSGHRLISPARAAQTCGAITWLRRRPTAALRAPLFIFERPSMPRARASS